MPGSFNDQPEIPEPAMITQSTSNDIDFFLLQGGKYHAIVEHPDGIVAM
jgi:hypothetical protein